MSRRSETSGPQLASKATEVPSARKETRNPDHMASSVVDWELTLQTSAWLRFLSLGPTCNERAPLGIETKIPDGSVQTRGYLPHKFQTSGRATKARPVYPSGAGKKKKKEAKGKSSESESQKKNEYVWMAMETVEPTCRRKRSGRARTTNPGRVSGIRVAARLQRRRGCPRE